MIKNLSVKYKLILIVTLTSGMALIIGYAAFITYDIMNYRSLRKSEVMSLARITGKNVRASLLFDDKEFAHEIITSLSAKIGVVSAYILTKEGEIFTEYHRSSPKNSLSSPELIRKLKETSYYKDGDLNVFHRIIFDKEPVGAVFIRFSMNEQFLRLKKDVLTAFIIASLSLLAALILSTRLRKTISHPILRLTGTVDRILKEKDYSLRTETPDTGDEIDVLAKGFNEMVEQIEEREIELKELVNRLTDSVKETSNTKKYVDNIIRSMMDTLIVITLDGIIVTVNQATLTLLNYKENELTGQEIPIIIQDELNFKGAWIDDLIEKGSVENIEKTYLSKDGRKIPVLFSGAVMYDDNDDVQGIVCVARDMTDRKQAEEQMRESLREKEVLLKEIHHRVKNNLSSILGLLYVAANTGEVDDNNAIGLLVESQNRIRSMAMIHEQLYESDNLAKIDFGKYLNNFAEILKQSYRDYKSRVTIEIEATDIWLDINKAVPCGLLIHELVVNSFKHAFPENREGEIDIKVFSKHNNEFTLIVKDNGIGMDKVANLQNAESMGLQLIDGLVKQLAGEYEFISDHGIMFQGNFKE